MLIEIIQQLVGLMVMLSCCTTIFLYARFKRHQRYSSGLYKRQSVLAYSVSTSAIVLIIGVYSQSFLHRLNFIEDGAMKSGLVNFESDRKIIIDTRPFRFCFGSTSLIDVNACLSRPNENLYTDEPNLHPIRLIRNGVDWS